MWLRKIGLDSSNEPVILWHGEHAFTHVKLSPLQMRAVESFHVTPQNTCLTPSPIVETFSSNFSMPCSGGHSLIKPSDQLIDRSLLFLSKLLIWTNCLSKGLTLWLFPASVKCFLLHLNLSSLHKVPHAADNGVNSWGIPKENNPNWSSNTCQQTQTKKKVQKN